MSIFLGKSKSYCYENREILAFRTGPGGLIAGCVSRHEKSAMMEFSLWIIADRKLLRVESLPLPHSRTVSDTNTDLFWHPSGNSVYVLHDQLMLIKVEWGDLYQNNRQVSLAEFYSLFLCEYHEKNQDEEGSYGVNLRLVRVVPDLSATSLHMTVDRNYLLFCNTTSTCTGPTAAVTIASADLKSVSTLYLAAMPTTDGMPLLTPDQPLTVHLSPLQPALASTPASTPTPTVTETKTLSHTTRPFQICSDRNSLGVVLGFSGSRIFLTQQHPERPSELLASSLVRLSMLGPGQQGFKNSNNGCSSSSDVGGGADSMDNGRGELEEEQGEGDEKYDDVDDYYNSEDEEEDCDKEEPNELDLESHGGELYAEEEESEGTGRVCDVLCIEPPYELQGVSKSSTAGGVEQHCSTDCVFYVLLLEHANMKTEFGSVSYEVVFLKVHPLYSGRKTSGLSYGCQVISRVSVLDTASPLSAHPHEEQAQSVGVRKESCLRLQCLRSDSSNAPSTLLVQLRHSIQCLGICGLRLLEAAFSARTFTPEGGNEEQIEEDEKENKGEGEGGGEGRGFLPCAQICQSALFSLDVGALVGTRRNNASATTVCFTVTANALLVTTSTSRRGSAGSVPAAASVEIATVVKEEEEEMHSFIHSIALLLSQSPLSTCITASPAAVGSALLDVSDGVMVVFGSGGHEQELDTLADGASSREDIVFPAHSSSWSPFHSTPLPLPLLRDMTLNRYKFKSPVHNKSEISDITAFKVAKGQLMHDYFNLKGGLISAVIECPSQGAEKRGYIVSAVSVSPMLVTEAEFYPRHRHELLAHHSYVWVQSTVTSKWKILHNPDAPPISALSLLHFPTPSLLTPLPSGKVAASRKKYHDNQNSLLGLLNIGWFEDHSIFMCTIRSPSYPSATPHCCLEVMSRASERTPSMTVEHNKYRNGRRDLRRLSSANVHAVVPLPLGFVPVFADCVNVSPDSSYSSEQSKTRSMSVASVTTEAETEAERVNEERGEGCSRVCIILLGNASGHFMTLQVTAKPESQKESMTDATTAASTTSITDVFKPSKYTVTLVWQCDLSLSTAVRTPQLDGVSTFTFGTGAEEADISPPLRSVHVLVSKEKTHATTQSSNDVSMLLLDMAGRVVKVHVGCGKDYNDVAPNQATESGSVQLTLINTGGCRSILRVCDSHIVSHALDKTDRDSSSPYLPKNMFVLTSFSGDDDVLFLAAFQTDDRWGSKRDRVMQAPMRPAGSTPIGKLELLGYGKSLYYASSAQDYLSPLSFSGSKSDNSAMQAQCAFPKLMLSQSLLPLSLLLGLLHCPNHSPTRIPPSPSPFSDTMLIAHSTYQHSTVALVSLLIDLIRQNNKSGQNSILTAMASGVETHMKRIIQSSGFTRYSPAFAIMTTVLFAADEMFFIDIFSKLARKLEPHVSLKLFPLPNYMPSSLKTGDKDSPSSNKERKLKYRDSFWNQLTLFEFCLQKKWLVHASRFLTIACEHLGGSQSIETIAACLVVATELLFESLRHLSLETALECLDFCVRLEMMAMELIALDDLWLLEQDIRGGGGMLQFIKTEVVGMFGLLSPLLGSDLHNVMEDAVDPHNPRNRIGFSLYCRPLYAHPHSENQLKYRLQKASGAAAHTTPHCLSFGYSSQKYFAFCAANISIEKHNSKLRQAVSATETMPGGSQNSLEGCSVRTLQQQMQVVCPGGGYTSTVLQLVVSSLVRAQKWISASVTMSCIQQHVLATSRTKISWVEESLYYKNLHMWEAEQPLGHKHPLFRGSHVAGLMNRMGLPSSLRMSPALPLGDNGNDDMRELLVQEWNVSQLQVKCVEEMLDARHFSEQCEKDPASLVTMGRETLLNTGNIDDTTTSGSVSATENTNACSLFALPDATPGSISLVNILQGSAAAALLTRHLEVVLFIAVILCQKDVAIACLGWKEPACRRVVIDFFLSRTKMRTQTQTQAREDTAETEEEILEEQASDRTTTDHQILLSKLFSSHNTISLRHIAEEILLYYSKIEG